MQIPSKYDPSLTEKKWYDYWMEAGFFNSEPDEREPFCIAIPPPNVTGVLHMGHMLNNTLQDVLIRRARMQGKNACWVPGTDHASIATEAKIVAKLKEEGIEKSDITREQFLEKAWDWKNKHGGIILEQLKKLGASCDWRRTKFTMDQDMYESVINVFIDLYNKGLIYRGIRMVNWDPKALTALSDEEVFHKEVNSKLYFVRYKVEDEEDSWVTVATTRPETILGDTGLCVHPEDERYSFLKGKKVLVPLIKRPVPVIMDEYVDREFGTGALKITPAHDINDYKLGLKYDLDVIDIFNDNGTLSEKAELYIGKDRFLVRKEIVADLEKEGHIVKVEDYVNSVGFSERTDEVIEPKLSLQWFLKMSELAKPALKVVMDDTIHFFPKKFKNTYRHWMENVTDWCISRQLWWGQRIPVYYLPDHKMVAAKSREEALKKAKDEHNLIDIKPQDIHQDEDVLDTWFSSWLWPISIFDGIRNPDNDDINYYYPTNDLVTAPEILFFWVARMIMAGLEYRNEIPFKNVYLTGIVRDKIGRKMSKSLGNSPDPIELMNKYGADGVRVGMLLTSPAGNDLPFDEILCEQGRNFSNKIWNALRLVKSWKVDEKAEQPAASKTVVDWFESRLNSNLKILNDHYNKYRISDALMVVYKMIWDDFCSWYLEMIKPYAIANDSKNIDKETYYSTILFFEKLMKVLHPFMPFITEEIWHQLKKREEKECIIVSNMPLPGKIDKELLDQFEYAKEVIMAIRKIRSDKNIKNKEEIELYIKKNFDEKPVTTFDSICSKLCNICNVRYTDKKIEDSISFVVKSTEFYIPLSESIDTAEEIQKLEAELKYTKGFLNSVMCKLNNEKFVANAPENVVANEKKKKTDAEARIKVIEEQLKTLR